MLVLNFPFFENKKYTAYDRFHGNGPYGEIPIKKEPIRTLGFALPYNKYLLLTELEVRTVSYGPSSRLGHKRGSVTYSTDRENEVSKIFIISLLCV